jgi:hypothetical protein
MWWLSREQEVGVGLNMGKGWCLWRDVNGGHELKSKHLLDGQAVMVCEEVVLV